jgi:hypothetical protein
MRTKKTVKNYRKQLTFIISIFTVALFIGASLTTAVENSVSVTEKENRVEEKVQNSVNELEKEVNNYIEKSVSANEEKSASENSIEEPSVSTEQSSSAVSDNDLSESSSESAFSSATEKSNDKDVSNAQTADKSQNSLTDAKSSDKAITAADNKHEAVPPAYINQHDKLAAASDKNADPNISKINSFSAASDQDLNKYYERFLKALRLYSQMSAEQKEALKQNELEKMGMFFPELANVYNDKLSDNARANSILQLFSSMFSKDDPCLSSASDRFQSSSSITSDDDKKPNDDLTRSLPAGNLRLSPKENGSSSCKFGNGSWFKSFFDSLGDLFSDFYFSDIVNGTINFFNGTINGFKNLFKNGINSTINFFNGTINFFKNGINGTINFFKNINYSNIGKFLDNTWNGLKNLGTGLWNGFTNLSAGFVNLLNNSWNIIGKPLINLTTTIFQNINLSNISINWDGILNLTGGLFTLGINAINNLVSAVLPIIGSIGQMIVNALPTIFELGKIGLGLVAGVMGEAARYVLAAGIVLFDVGWSAGTNIVEKIRNNLPDIISASKEGFGSGLDKLMDILFNPEVTGPNTNGTLLDGAFGEISNLDKLSILLNSFFNDGFSVGDFLKAFPFAGEDAIKAFQEYFNEEQPDEPTDPYPSDGEENEQDEEEDDDDEQNGDEEDEDDEPGKYDEIVFNGNNMNSVMPNSNLLCEPLLAEASNLGYSYTDLEKLSMMAIPPGMLRNINDDIALPNGLFSSGSSASSASSLSLTLEAGVCCAAVSYCAQSMGISLDLTGFNMNTNTFGGNSNPSTQPSSSSTTSSSTTSTTGHTSTSTTTILFTN